MNITTYIYRNILIDKGCKEYDLKGLWFNKHTPISGMGTGQVELYIGDNGYLYGNFIIDTDLWSRTGDAKEWVDSSIPSILRIKIEQKKGNYITKGCINRIILHPGDEKDINSLRCQVTSDANGRNEQTQEMVKAITNLLTKIGDI